MNLRPQLIAFVCLSLGLLPPDAPGRSDLAATGFFPANSDVGAPSQKGSVQRDIARGAYVVSGGGANMWATNDAFQFVWRKVSGDVSLTADIKFIGTEGDAHRKACLMLRQTLDADSVYADAALHGNGLTALQYRETKGATTKEIHATNAAPERLRIEKRGDNITVSIPASGEKAASTVGTIQLHFDAPFYVGLAVCSHDNKTLRQAEFTKVELHEAKER